MQRIVLSSDCMKSFDRSKPCIFTLCTNETEPHRSEDNGTITRVAAEVSSILSRYNTLSTVEEVIGGDNVNNVRIYDSDHNYLNCIDMTFSDYCRTISSGEASLKDMYWAYAKGLQRSDIDEIFSDIEMMLGIPSPSPPLVAWVGSKHTEQLHYDDEDNFHFMISGQKRWLIFPPNSNLQYPTFRSLLVSPSVPSLSSEIPPDPCTSCMSASVLNPQYDVLLSPGDLLYLPAAWSHEVHSLPESPTSYVFSVNKFYPTSLLACAWRGTLWPVVKSRTWAFKMSREGWT